MPATRCAGFAVVATLLVAVARPVDARGGDEPPGPGPTFGPTTVAPGLAPAARLGDSVAELGRRTGFPVWLGGEGPGGLAASGGPATKGAGGGTFWEVFDRLALDSAMEIVPRMAVEGRRIELIRASGRPAQATLSGPYRCSLIRLVEARSISYGGDSASLGDGGLREPARMAGPGLPPSRSDSFALVSVLAEPRPLIDVELAGPPRVDEAIDDLGRSMVVPAPKRLFPGRYLGDRWGFGFDIRVPLDIRRPPGRSIRRLKGSIPVLTWVAHPDLIEVDLADPPGRPIRRSGVILTVLPRPATARADAVVLKLAPDDPKPGPGDILPLFGSWPGRMFVDHGLQFALLAGDGSRIAVDVRTDGVPPPIGAFQVTLTPREKPRAGAPTAARLHFRGLAWSRDEAPFSCEEVPLP